MRHIPRLYLDADFQTGETCSLTPTQFHHLHRVLRLESGAEIRIFNGQQGEWQAELAIESQKSGALLVQDLMYPQPNERELLLLFALIKPTRLSILVEKVTELGVTDFFPLTTDYSDIRQFNAAKFADIALSAAQQCGRLSIPRWHPLQSLRSCLQEWDPNTPLYVCAEKGDRQRLSAIVAKDRPKKTALLIGPEGGFSATEYEDFQQHSSIHLVSLGHNILRSETAAIAALAVVQ